MKHYCAEWMEGDKSQVPLCGGIPVWNEYLTIDPFDVECVKCNERLMEQAAGPKEYRISKDQWKPTELMYVGTNSERVKTWDPTTYIAEPLSYDDRISIRMEMDAPLPRSDK